MVLLAILLLNLLRPLFSYCYFKIFYFITLLTTMNPVSWGGWPPNFCCTVVLLAILLLNLLRPLIFYDLLALTAKTAVCLPGPHAATARPSAALWTSKWVQKNLEEKFYISPFSQYIISRRFDFLKVSKSQKQILKSRILPKNVFERIKDIIICFRDLLTFNGHKESISSKWFPLTLIIKSVGIFLIYII